MAKDMYVDAPHFFAGLTVNADGYILEAAPILRWTIGKQEKWFIQYCNKKKWKYEDG